jgi:YfiH family protein
MRGSWPPVHDWIVPDWPAHPRVHAVSTTRTGGVSDAPYASMNPAAHVGDSPVAVQENRARLATQLPLPATPLWLQQVHGTRVADAATAAALPEADGAWSAQANVVCAVLTADCLPLLLSDRDGRCVAAVHAGWRGLAAGVIEHAVAALPAPGDALLAWLGPAIGPKAYIVGDEVRAAFMARDARAASAFAAHRDAGWHADLYQLARQRLAACGVAAVYGGDHCTLQEAGRFFSFRRDGVTGRMATLIWLAGA